MADLAMLHFLGDPFFPPSPPFNNPGYVPVLGGFGTVFKVGGGWGAPGMQIVFDEKKQGKKDR